MLTLAEVLDDASALPEFSGVQNLSASSRGLSGQTPLHWMATLGDIAGVNLLVHAGAEMDAQDIKGNTPLHEAVLSRQHHAARRLLECGARSDVRNGAGQTPADLARADGYAPVLEVLSNAG